ncbi:nitrate reductase molybdenum cofactor assembly chaperone [Mycobacterium kansasii]|uniref:Nitrate reductase molybdenum cofactor assembly chaperone n=1 Tax=Mycobacterium kansasii TaxID=1768 RepID=A0A1V3XI96_MYCKA|nr:nitrate reductase molybdenum cofactor assembly chaperone [Mycobacterium kansasii]
MWRVAALLLDYPSEQTVELTAQLIAAAMQLPSAIHAGLLEFLYHFRGANLLQLQANYVETFDMRRRASLHLTYYAYGDTRKRGMALLRFKHAYRQAATGIGDGELPDYLPLVLEFAAMIDQVQGERLLVEHVPCSSCCACPCRTADRSTPACWPRSWPPCRPSARPTGAGSPSWPRRVHPTKKSAWSRSRWIRSPPVAADEQRALDDHAVHRVHLVRPRPRLALSHRSVRLDH